MKKSCIIVFLVLSSQSFSLFGQCIADAGPNKVVCVETIGLDTNLLGGDPTATGGSPPYTYAWDALYVYVIGSHTYYFRASDFLDDTTLANPTVVEWIDQEDWIEFHLTVTDADNVVCRDTTSIRFSQYTIFPASILFNINQGDSIYLNYGINLSGGIPPYEYLWRPNHGLSDSTSLSFWAKPEHSIAYYVTLTDSAGCSMQGPCFYFIFVTPVSIEEQAQSQQVLIYPNPCQNYISFKLNSESLQNFHINIYDMRGKLMIAEMNLSGEFSVNISALQSGIYYFKIEENGLLIVTGKFVVKK